MSSLTKKYKGGVPLAWVKKIAGIPVQSAWIFYRIRSPLGMEMKQSCWTRGGNTYYEVNLVRASQVPLKEFLLFFLAED